MSETYQSTIESAMKKARVICTTLAIGGTYHLPSLKGKTDYLIIDEAC